VTATFQREHEIRRRLTNWGALLGVRPQLIEREDTVLSFVWDPKAGSSVTTPGGASLQPITARQSAMADAWKGLPGTLAPWARVPAEIKDERERMYWRLRMACEHDVLAFSAVNPSTLVVFARVVAESSERLIAELEAGTVVGAQIVVPNSARARELRDRLRDHGTLSPAQIWPRATTITCWKSGSCALYLPRLSEAYGKQVQILPAAAIASEAPITCTVDIHERAHPLAIFSVFFEFLPTDASDSIALSFDELEAGREYELILTQPCGLYRYAIGDIFRVDSFYRSVPRLDFVGRKGVFSSFTGEKLTERQILDAARAALDTCRLNALGLTCCPVWGEPPHYAYVIELERVCADAERARLAEALEVEIHRHNDEYQGKRSNGRLGAVRLHLVRTGTFDRYRQERIAAGASSVQLKEKLLADPGALERLASLSDGWL
jgi:hypothetical protein